MLPAIAGPDGERHPANRVQGRSPFIATAASQDTSAKNLGGGARMRADRIGSPGVDHLGHDAVTLLSVSRSAFRATK
jgi:hypothetical protein